MRRSILTEKVARRGFHLSREYSVDPLELIYVREVMRTNIAVLRAERKLGEILPSLRNNHRQQQRLVVVVDRHGKLAGIATRGDLFAKLEKEKDQALGQPLLELITTAPTLAHPDETLRTVVYRMAESGLTRMPVVERDSGKLVGLVALDDLLKARTRHLEEEQRRDRPLHLRYLLPGAGSRSTPESTVAN